MAGDGQGIAARVADASAAADFSRPVDAALEESKTGISRGEAQKRLAALLAAAAFIAEQMRVLSSARIHDDVEFPELASAMEKLTTRQALTASTACSRQTPP